MCLIGCGVLVVVIVLIVGFSGFDFVIYSVIKYGIVVLVKIVVIEGVLFGVCVNGIVFGLIDIFFMCVFEELFGGGDVVVMVLYGIILFGCV